MPFVEIKDFTVAFEQKILLQNFSLSVEKGECVGIFAPTGSGKTTLLNHIASTYAQTVKISYVFQDNKLIPHLSLKKNILLPVKNKNDFEATVQKIIDKLDLKNCAETIAKKASGGEKQRANFARALVYDGELFLMDEPFSAQDEAHKKLLLELTHELKKSHAIIIVSHDKGDLLDLADRIVEI